MRCLQSSVNARRGTQASYKNSRSAFDSANEFDNELDAHYHAYGRAVLPLQKQLRGLQAQDDAEQRRRDAQFPQDKTSFQAIINKDTKVCTREFNASHATMGFRKGWSD